MSSKSATALFAILLLMVSGCSQSRVCKVLVPLRAPLDRNESCHVGQFTAGNGGLLNPQFELGIREAVAEGLRAESTFADVSLGEVGHYKYVLFGKLFVPQRSHFVQYVEEPSIYPRDKARRPRRERRIVWNRGGTWAIEFVLKDALSGEVVYSSRVYSLRAESRYKFYGCVTQFAQKLREAGTTTH